MDGEEGETHPEFGARIIRRLFGDEWGDFCLYHSRHYAKRDGKNFSQICVADKFVPFVMPKWLYLGLAQSTGEIVEYRTPKLGREETEWIGLTRDAQSDSQWYDYYNQYMGRWVIVNQWNGTRLPQSRRNKIKSKI
jgi:hypothetical protein